MSGSRRSIRLAEYDYTDSGAYFITILTHQRENIFGEVVNGVMSLNAFGCIVEEEWVRSEVIRTPWVFTTHVVMPDHLHGIVEIQAINNVRAHSCAPLRNGTEKSRCYRPPRSLGSFVSGFKASCTTKINTLRNTPGQPIWHRNYYEHVVRDEDDLEAIHAYIETNPANWETDDPFHTEIISNLSHSV